MPKMAQKVTIDEANRRVLIDGEEFPYYLSEDGLSVSFNGITRVNLTLLAGTVEHIPYKG